MFRLGAQLLEQRCPPRQRTSVGKRVRSDRPLGELSSGREVPPEPPENWLNLNRRSSDISSQLSDDLRRCLIKTSVGTSQSKSEPYINFR